MQKNPYRLDRIADMIQQELGRLLKKEVKDPRLNQVTVTAVQVSRDLSQAKIYVTLLEKEKLKDTLKALKKAAGYLRFHLAQTLNLRITPELKFFYDASIERGAHLTQLIDEAVAQDKKKGGV